MRQFDPTRPALGLRLGAFFLGADLEEFCSTDAVYLSIGGEAWMGSRGLESRRRAVTFGELPVDDQNRILIEVLRLFINSDLHSLKVIADDRGITSGELWREICAGAGLGPCEPWPGFPKLAGIPPDP